MKKYGAHPTHCCETHGCKYSDPDCPVASHEVPGIFCEDCEYDFIDKETDMAERRIIKPPAHDFGFTIEDSAATEDRAQQMFDAIMPLLENLKQNPEVETIKWPNRVAKINQFEAKLREILRG